MGSSEHWSIKIGKIRSTAVRLHVSAILLIPLLALVGSTDRVAAASQVLFGGCLLAAVFVHELGHAAARFLMRIPTTEILIYPFGGISRSTGVATPLTDLVVASSGIAASVLMAIILAPYVQMPLDESGLVAANLATRLFASCSLIVVFNLVPALPLDGGVILRACLSWWGAKRSAELVGRLSQVLSILIGVFALLAGNVLLILVASTVFLYDLQQTLRSRAASIASGLFARDAVADPQVLVVLSHGTTVTRAIDKALRVYQTIFPVVHAETLLGVVTKDRLFRAAASELESDYVSSVMERDILRVQADQPLGETIELMSNAGAHTVAVLEGSTFCGLIFKDKLTEFLVMRGVRDRAQHSSPVDGEAF